jgi:hypothetical protein
MFFMFSREPFPPLCGFITIIQENRLPLVTFFQERDWHARSDLSGRPSPWQEYSYLEDILLWSILRFDPPGVIKVKEREHYYLLTLNNSAGFQMRSEHIQLWDNSLCPHISISSCLSFQICSDCRGKLNRIEIGRIWRAGETSSDHCILHHNLSSTITQ